MKTTNNSWNGTKYTLCYNCPHERIPASEPATADDMRARAESVKKGGDRRRNGSFDPHTKQGRLFWKTPVDVGAGARG